MSTAYKLPPEPVKKSKPALKQVFNASTAQKHKPASTGKRIVAVLIDGVIIQITTKILVTIVIARIFASPVHVKLAEIGLSFFCVPIFYWAYLTYSMGATPGKKIMGLKVISTKKRKLSFGQVLKRETLFRGISISVFGLGYITGFFDEEKRTWHDKLAHTRVIQHR